MTVECEKVLKKSSADDDIDEDQTVSLVINRVSDEKSEENV